MSISSNQCQRVFSVGIGCTQAELYLNGMLVGSETYLDGELSDTNIYYNTLEQIPELNKITSNWDGSVLAEYTDEYLAQNPNSFDTWRDELRRIDDDNHPFPFYLENADQKEVEHLMSIRNLDFNLFVEIMTGLTKQPEKIFIYQDYSPKEPFRRKLKRKR